MRGFLQANKASNMMEHAEEIYARPKKQWFQSSKQKFETQEQVTSDME